MQNFEFYAPTQIVFGKGTEDQIGRLVKEQGCKKVLVHYGGGSVVKSGLLDRVYRSLEQEGISYVSLGGVVPNPRLSKVYEGIELGRKEGVDFMLAVGGGSVIDSAKAIGYGLCYDGDVWDFYDGIKEPSACLPLGCILTIAAAGSEMSAGSVITKEEGWLKRSCDNNLGRSKFSIMDPELTYTLPPYQTASGCVDIIMHTMERYFVKGETLGITDEIAEAVMRTVMTNAKILVEDPKNYKARAEVMWAGSLAHNDLTGCGVDAQDWSCHQLEHELGGMFDVTHGAGLAAVWGSWARYVYEEAPARFAQFAVQVMGVADQGSEKATAMKGIEAMEEFYRAIQMPTNIHELGVDLTEEQIKELAYKCSFQDNRTIGGFKVLNRTDMEKIYRMARGI